MAVVAEQLCGIINRLEDIKEKFEDHIAEYQRAQIVNATRIANLEAGQKNTDIRLSGGVKLAYWIAGVVAALALKVFA